VSQDNNVTVVGNLTRDPESTFLASGAHKVTLGIAVNRRWQNRQTQEWEEQVSFFNVICWRELADNVRDSLAKGQRVIITGRLEQRSWEAEGAKRSVVEIIADDVAPSLRFATADVLRNPKKDSSPVDEGEIY
jgi:single-strand DNA-binding protein